MKIVDKTVLFLATGFYTGNIPKAPGTFGTLPALPLCYLLSTWEPMTAFLFSMAFIALAVVLAHTGEKMLKKKDPGCIVIDEMAGMLITLIGLPFNAFTVVTGFIIFRVLDIVKPVPIRTLERKISGGAGIVADDVAAGIIANITLRIILYLSELMM